MKKTVITIAMGLALALFQTSAQVAESSSTPSGELSGGGPGGGGPRGGPGQGGGGQRSRPSPEQMAAHLMEKFDANKDGELEQDELTEALKALRRHHPPGPGGSPGGGALQSGTGHETLSSQLAAGQSGQTRGPQGGGRQGAGQGGPGADGGHRPPPADIVAAHMIERFSSDKKGLTQEELAKALEERREHRGLQGGGHRGGPGGGPGGAPVGTPAGGASNP